MPPQNIYVKLSQTQPEYWSNELHPSRPLLSIRLDGNRSSLGNRAIARSLAFILVLCVTALQGQSSEAGKPIFFVEEHWEVKLREPDPQLNSPQISFFTFPNRDRDDRYFELQLNYAAGGEVGEDGYSSGGFRVSAVSNANELDDERSVDNSRWATTDDTVRWTTVIANRDGHYLFAIKNGHCGEWGRFGGPEYLVQLDADGDANLTHYHPSASMENVDVGFGRNRVKSITLLKLRVVYRDGTETWVDLNRTVL